MIEILFATPNAGNGGQQIVILADTVAFTVTIKIILDNTCRIDKISIPGPVTVMIITLLEIV